jgi:hypothetical protein
MGAPSLAMEGAELNRSETAAHLQQEASLPVQT